MDFILRELLLGAAIPGLIAAATFYLALRREEPPAWTGAVAMAAAYLFGHWVVKGFQPFPPVETTGWIPFLVLASVALGLAMLRYHDRPWPQVAPVVLTGLALWLTMRPLYIYTWNTQEALFYSVGFAAAWLGLWSALHFAVRAVKDRSLPLALSMAAGASAIVLALSGTALFGQLTGALAAGLGGVTIIAWRRRRFDLGLSAVPVLAVILPVVWLNGLFYAEVPVICVVLLAISTSGIAITRLKYFAKDNSAYAMVAIGIGVAIPALLAVLIAWAKAEAVADAGPYGDFYR